MDGWCERQELKIVCLATNIGQGVDLDKACLRGWSRQIGPHWGLKNCFRFINSVWTAAVPAGQFVANEGTEETDRTCGECVQGVTFSVSNNSVMCTAVQPCPNGWQETEKPTTTSDRVCATTTTTTIITNAADVVIVVIVIIAVSFCTLAQPNVAA